MGGLPVARGRRCTPRSYEGVREQVPVPRSLAIPPGSPIACRAPSAGGTIGPDHLAKEEPMTSDSTSGRTDLDSQRRNDLLEFAEFLGLDKEAEELRGEARTERILPRLKRALDLAGLPIGTGGPGITTPCASSSSSTTSIARPGHCERPPAVPAARADHRSAGDLPPRHTKTRASRRHSPRVSICSVTSVDEAFGRGKILVVNSNSHAVRLSWSLARWLWFARSRGLPCHQAWSRMRLRAAALVVWSRWVLARPR